MHSPLPGGRPQPDGYVGPQGKHQLRLYRHQRRRHPHLRTPAPDGRAHGQALADPVNADAGDQPPAGDHRVPHRPSAQPHHEVPRVRLHRGQGNGSPKRHAAVHRGSHALGERLLQLRGGLQGLVHRRRVRRHDHSGPQRRGICRARPPVAQISLFRSHRGPEDSAQHRGPALPGQPGGGRVRQDGHLPRAGAGHDLVVSRPRRRSTSPANQRRPGTRTDATASARAF